MSIPSTPQPTPVRTGQRFPGFPNALSIDKAVLAQNFSAAAEHYDAWATAHQKIAGSLAQRIPAGFSPARTVDLGCGTGLLSAQLLRRYPRSTLLGIDIAEGMVEYCRRRFMAATAASFVRGDVESRSFLAPGVSLVASSCVSQWFSRPAETFRLWAECLAPGGVMALASLVRGSFHELESASREALRRGFRGLRLPPREALPELVQSAPCGLRLISCDEESLSVYYDSPGEALRSFQQIGAVFHNQPDHEVLKPGETRRLLACYGREASVDGRVPVTYRVQYLVAEKTW